MAHLKVYLRFYWGIWLVENNALNLGFLYQEVDTCFILKIVD